MITLLTVFDTGLWFDVIFISDTNSGTGLLYFLYIVTNFVRQLIYAWHPIRKATMYYYSERCFLI